MFIQNLWSSNQLSFQPVKIRSLIFAVGVSYIVFRLSYDILSKKFIKDRFVRYIKFDINENHYECEAYVDKGNSLKEPFTGKPVVIVEDKILNLGEIFDFENISYSSAEKIMQAIGAKVLLIPYKTIGKEQGVLYGIIPNQFFISKDKLNWIKKDVIVGIYNKKISNKYSALLGIDLI